MRMLALDGWRGLACLFVAIFHLNVAHSLYFLPVFQNGAPILELFFVISGFVMSMTFADSIRNGRGFAAYLIRVSCRLFPLHWLTLAPLVLLIGAKALAGARHDFSSAFSLESLIPQIFNVHTWFGYGLTWNYPAWTLSGEMAAYLIFAVVMLAIGSRGGRLLASLLLIVISGAIFAAELGPREGYNVISVARCVVGFFVGYVLFDLWRWRQIQSARTGTIIELIAVAGFAVSLHARFDGAAYFINYPLVAFVVWAFASGKGVLSKLIANPVLLWLGKISFSLYMIHAVIKIYLAQAFFVAERVTGDQYYHWFQVIGGEPIRLISLGSAGANDLMLLGYLAVAFAAAALLYRFVEEPTRRISVRWARQAANAPKGAFAPGHLWQAARRRLGA